MCEIERDEYTQEDRNQEILADHADENLPAEDNDPIQLGNE